MVQPPPARVGDHVDDIETPALIVDLDAFERNLKIMQETADRLGVKLRPHAKTHKSPVVAMRQMALGAVGQCCQKVGEAEAMVDGGILDVLVSNEVVGRRKLDRLAALAGRARIGVCVDHPDQISALAESVAVFDTRIEVLVEIDVGAGRCGVAPGEPAVELVKAIEAAPGLSFGGLQAYHGSAQHIRGWGERRQAIRKAADGVKMTKDALAAAGIDCPRVTGAGTGSFEFEAETGLWDEIQCGSYAFMDADYGRNFDEAGDPVSGFRNSLFVLASVMSAPAPGRAVCDAGHKSSAIDSGLPAVHGRADVTYAGASDEHGSLVVGAGAEALGLGDKVWLIPGHCDPTINLHDWFVAIRGGRVEALWPVAARGALR